VAAVAIGADRGFLRTGSNGVPVNALLVRGDHLRALAAIFHDELLAVAGPARRGNICVMHARFRVTGGQQFVGTAVTIHTAGRLTITTFEGFAVEAAIVGGLLVGMAGGTSNFLGNGLVCSASYVGVAIHAGEHAAVNGILESLRIDVQADRPAVFLMRQRSIAMANEAFVYGWFGRLFASGAERARS